MVNIDKIKERAKVKGITITYLCNAISQGPYYLNDVKKRGGDMPDDRLAIIADLLDTTPEYLRDETDDPEKKKPHTEPDEELDGNVLIIRGRDGRYIKKVLTDKEIESFETLFKNLPDLPDDL